MAVTIAQIASSHHPSRQIKPTDRRSKTWTVVEHAFCAVPSIPIGATLIGVDLRR